MYIPTCVSLCVYICETYSYQPKYKKKQQHHYRVFLLVALGSPGQSPAGKPDVLQTLSEQHRIVLMENVRLKHSRILNRKKSYGIQLQFSLG